MGKILFFFLELSIMLLFISCDNSKIETIKSKFDINLENVENYHIEESHWNDFNGDGFRIISYNVNKENKRNFSDIFKFRGGIYNKKDFFSNSELEKYIESDSVLYLCKEYNDETHILLFEEKKSIVIYYYEIH